MGEVSHLLAAFGHDPGVVLAQVDVAAKTGGAPRVPVLLDSLDLIDMVVIADAAYTRRANASSLHAYGGTTSCEAVRLAQYCPGRQCR